jgi:hypothetical protein
LVFPIFEELSVGGFNAGMSDRRLKRGGKSLCHQMAGYGQAKSPFRKSCIKASNSSFQESFETEGIDPLVLSNT